MSRQDRFSEDWHSFFKKLSPDNRCLLNLEHHVHAWNGTLSALSALPSISDYKELADHATETSKKALEFVTLNADYLRRIVLIRSEQLAVGFLQSFNVDNYTAAPVLLRALLEEGARGLHAASQISNHLSNIESDPDPAIRRVIQDLVGSRANIAVVQRLMASRAPEILAPMEYALQMFETFWQEAALHGWNPKAKAEDANEIPAINVLSMIEGAEKVVELDTSSGLDRVDHPLLLVYAWLSDMSHPASQSWTLIYDRVTEGGAYRLDPASLSSLRAEAAGAYLQIAETFVFPLPGVAFANLTRIVDLVT
jgi:hypothetical protein